MRFLTIAATVLLLWCPAVFAKDINMHAIVYPPLVYEAGGKILGVAPDVVRAIQKELGETNPLNVMPWLRAYNMAQENERQALFAIVRIPERENLFKWIGPIFSEGDYFFQKRGGDLKIKNLDDARRVERIAVRRDGYTHQALKAKRFFNLDVGPATNSSYKNWWRDGSISCSWASEPTTTWSRKPDLIPMTSNGRTVNLPNHRLGWHFPKTSLMKPSSAGRKP